MDHMNHKLTPRQLYVANKKPRFHPLTTKLTSTSWDGDSKGVADNGIIDLSAVFGLPAGITAVLLRLSMNDTTVGASVTYGPNAANNNAIILRAQVSGQLIDQTGIVPCDPNGDIYTVFSQTLDNVYIVIYGYWI